METIAKRDTGISRNKRGGGKLVPKSSLAQQSDILKIPVAVYGTLKQRFGNHALLEDALFVGEGKTKDRYPLVIRESGLPFLLKKRNKGHQVYVELYLVDTPTLSKLDILEGHPAWYKREKVPIIMPDNENEPVDAWVYFGPKEYDENQGYYERY